MAEVIGAPGNSAQEESFRQLRLKVWTVFGFVLFAGFYLGWYVATGRRSSPTMPLLMMILALCAIVMVTVFMRRHEEAERRWRRGADGEVLVAALLGKLPDGFVVINDIPKRAGNIDHIVIGPTGLFLLNTKNWRGRITANGAGEILLNDRKTDHPEVRNLAHAVMDLHGKVQARCDKEYFVQGVLVFVHGRVEAGFSATKPVHCLTEDGLLSYLDNEKYSGRLAPADVQKIKNAVLGIARMNGGLTGSQPV